MFRTRHLPYGLAGALVALVAIEPIQAQSRDWFEPARKTKASIKTLRADLHFDRGLWMLVVQYEVEIKRPHPAARLDFVMNLTERKRQVFDASGQPVVIGVPLERPASINRKGDKVIFRDVISVNLPNALFSRPKDLRVESRVVDSDFGRVHDRKNRSVKHDRRGDWMASGFSVAPFDPRQNLSAPRW